jgi:hypothetical protein
MDIVIGISFSVFLFGTAFVLVCLGIAILRD